MRSVVVCVCVDSCVYLDRGCGRVVCVVCIGGGKRENGYSCRLVALGIKLPTYSLTPGGILAVVSSLPRISATSVTARVSPLCIQADIQFQLRPQYPCVAVLCLIIMSGVLAACAAGFG